MEHVRRLEAAFADGAVTAAQVGVLADAVKPAAVTLAQEQGIDLDAFDEARTQVATTLPHATLATAVNAFRNALDADGPEPDPRSPSGPGNEPWPTPGRALSLARAATGLLGRGDRPLLTRYAVDQVAAEITLDLTRAGGPGGQLAAREPTGSVTCGEAVLSEGSGRQTAC